MRAFPCSQWGGSVRRERASLTPGMLAAGGRRDPGPCPPQVTMIPHKPAGVTFLGLQLGALASPWARKADGVR